MAELPIEALGITKTEKDKLCELSDKFRKLWQGATDIVELGTVKIWIARFTVRITLRLQDV